MGNVCSLNTARTVCWGCPSSVAFPHGSGGRWAVQKHHVEHSVGLVSLCSSPVRCGPGRAGAPRGRGHCPPSGAAAGPLGCAGSGRPPGGARRKRQGAPAAERTAARAATRSGWRCVNAALQTLTFPNLPLRVKNSVSSSSGFFLLSSLKYFTNFNNCSL